MAIKSGEGAFQKAVLVHGRIVIAPLLIDQPALELFDADQEFLPQRIEEGESLFVTLLDAFQIDIVVELGLGKIEQGFKSAAGEIQLLGDCGAAKQSIGGKLAAIQTETFFGMKAAEV